MLSLLVERIINDRPHPEQGYRSCLGIIGLAKRFGADRLEAAAVRALEIQACNYPSVKSILEKGLDHVPVSKAPEREPIRSRLSRHRPRRSAGRVSSSTNTAIRFNPK